MTRHRWWLLLIAAALIPRLAWAIALTPRKPYADEVRYMSHARRLVEGKGYTNEYGRRTAYWPVGYPAVLAVCYRVAGDSRVTGVVLQVVLGIATAALISVIGIAAFGPRIGRSAALLVAVYPNHVFYAPLFLTEPLFTFLVVASAALLMKSLAKGAAATAAAGMVLGLAALVRGVILLLPLVLLVWYWRQKWPFSKVLARTALAGSFALIAVSPWLMRNHGVTGSWFVLSTNAGQNFWMGNYPGAFGGYAYRQAINEQLRTPTGSIPEDFDANGAGMSPSRGYRLGFAAIATSPSRAVLRAFQKVSYFFALETDGALWNLKGLAQPPPRLVSVMLLCVANAAYLFLITFAVLGLMCAPRTHPLASLFLLLTGYLVLVAVVFVGDPRYHYPLIPMAAIFSAKGFREDWPVLWKAVQANNSGARRTLFGWGAITVAFLALMAGNVVLKLFEFKAQL